MTDATGPRKANAFRGPSRLLALALVASAFAALIPGTAQARAARPARAPGSTRVAAAANPSATCLVHSLPSFTAQGEFETTATVGDVVEVECNPEIYGTGSKVKITASQLFSRCKGKLTWYVPNPFTVVEGGGVTVELDADGNATVALLAGPGCAAGESLVTAHMQEEPFETFTTSFTVLPPRNTTPGVFALPAAQVEDANSSAVATIIETEFAGGSEKNVHISSEELFHRCRVAPHLHWVRMSGKVETGTPEVREVQLDNNGNAFVIAIGDASCAEGPSLIEADLESKPFTTFSTTFTVEAPQPTGEPSFSIEKSQEIAGSATGFTTSPLTGAIGQTVAYQIIVRNTSGFAETFSEFTDTQCDAGTIAGGPGSSKVPPGQSTTYTCNHLLAALGAYANEATVTGTTSGGTPVTHTSNQVVVEVRPGPSPPPPGSEGAFVIEKLQEIAGSAAGFTTLPLTGAIGQTVDYEIVVKNTGRTALVFSNFSDAHCDPGTIAGGPGAAPVAPGATTTYTCSLLLTSLGTYVNLASLTGVGQGEQPLTRFSNPVEVKVPAKPGPPPKGPGTTNQTLPPGGGSLPRCEREGSPPVLRGASGPRSGPFTLQMSSQGIKRITFYLDGRKLKTLAQSQAKAGKFTITIDPRKLSYGPHKVSLTALKNNRNCASIARSGAFVRPFTAHKPPKFTG